MDNLKRELGRYYTVNSPFTLKSFSDWFSSIKDISVIIEPFAGTNNIPYLMNDAGFHYSWSCYDIIPTIINKCPEFSVTENDSILNHPKKCKLVITNPPYLAKNSATRRNLKYPNTNHDDLYKECLEQMLLNSEYVAAIVPESFITAGLFQSRLVRVISLTAKMFDDTDCPVCLALFGPDETEDFDIYQQDVLLGKFSELKKFVPTKKTNIKWVFNDPNASIGVICIDGIKSRIEFVDASCYQNKQIKSTSRAYTRISCSESFDLKQLIKDSNIILQDFRSKTKDVFLTSYKGLRDDNQYRRRLDFALVKCILNQALEKQK